MVVQFARGEQQVVVAILLCLHTVRTFSTFVSNGTICESTYTVYLLHNEASFLHTWMHV